MSLPDPHGRVGAWLRGDGPQTDVVVSCRVRLARNIAGFPFLSRTNEAQRQELVTTCERYILAGDLPGNMAWLDLAQSPALQRRMLVERHLISRELSEAEGPRGVSISDDEQIAIMVNEEDHLRIQVLCSGMQVDEAYEAADRVDDALESKLDFAYSAGLGYLTACPTNVGTGVRVSVMLHLPALKLTGEINKVKRSAKDMHLAVRGFYGEGTEAVGDFYQVSNQTTLGRSEAETLHDFQDVVIPAIVDYERKARQALIDRRPAVLDDKAYRALGTCRHARLLSGDEAMQLLSYLRLGVSLGRLDAIDMATINDLFLLTQSAHLQEHAGRPLEGAERREYRARLLRERVGA